MATSISFDSINSRLDELHTDEKNAKVENDVLDDLLKNTSTMEEKMKILDTIQSINNMIALILKERLKLIQMMKIQNEKGRCRCFLVFFI